MYILECCDGTFYTGSTIDLENRFKQHQQGDGANYTKKRLPVKLIYYEEYDRIDEAFYREKQIQGWNRKKKRALINGDYEKLPGLAECMNDSHFRNFRAKVISTPLNNRTDMLNDRTKSPNDRSDTFNDSKDPLVERSRNEHVTNDN
tara:strand:+ start:669 stop:1109 length:441 start_codon:yes stop_codon:yes gene_type:complete